LIAVSWWQGLLDGLGAVLAFLYNLIPNYGVSIILLTLLIRLVLLPLGIKQIRSMQAMQAMQPRIKEIQRKYKGDRQRINEATMALYKEHGANPLSGCLPLLLQFPVLIALYAIIRIPNGLPHIPHSDSNPVVGRSQDSRLYVDIHNQRTNFLGMNLLCSATNAGSEVQLNTEGYPDAPTPLHCGKGAASRIPFYIFAIAMVGSQYYLQRQMQRASPAASQQQQALTRIMPLLFGFWGFIFPAGLVVYWTTSNLVQIGQQHFMLRGRAGPAAGGDGDTTKPGSARPAGRAGTKAALTDGKGAKGKPGPSGRRPGATRRGGGAASGTGRDPVSRGAGGGRSGGRPGRSGRPRPTPEDGPGRERSENGSTNEGTGQRPSGGAQRGQSGSGRKKRRKR
jgi:YidC/Oxa1 family membrane protein insertase